jgi:hypothetical protein
MSDPEIKVVKVPSVLLGDPRVVRALERGQQAYEAMTDAERAIVDAVGAAAERRLLFGEE